MYRWKELLIVSFVLSASNTYAQDLNFLPQPKDGRVFIKTSGKGCTISNEWILQPLEDQPETYRVATHIRRIMGEGDEILLERTKDYRKRASEPPLWNSVVKAQNESGRMLDLYRAEEDIYVLSLPLGSNVSVCRIRIDDLRERSELIAFRRFGADGISDAKPEAKAGISRLPRIVSGEITSIGVDEITICLKDKAGKTYSKAIPLPIEGQMRK